MKKFLLLIALSTGCGAYYGPVSENYNLEREVDSEKESNDSVSRKSSFISAEINTSSFGGAFSVGQIEQPDNTEKDEIDIVKELVENPEEIEVEENACDFSTPSCSEMTFILTGNQGSKISKVGRACGKFVDNICENKLVCTGCTNNYLCGANVVNQMKSLDDPVIVSGSLGICGGYGCLEQSSEFSQLACGEKRAFGCIDSKPSDFNNSLNCENHKKQGIFCCE